MNYITSCPKCDTHFLLNDELIKAHRGKVQCGSCEHVFNAKNRLTEVADDVTSADEYQATLEEHIEISDEADSFTFEITSNNEHELPAPEADDTTIFSTQENTSPQPERTPEFDFLSSVDDSTKNLHLPKRSKTQTALLSILSLLLLLAAMIQTVYHFRVKIAAEHPQFKPLLIKACAQFHCTIDLPKELDLITIGDSDMQEDENYKSVINFISSLKNNADYPQAYPSIELTLTNANDQVVIKKLISPKEYLSDEKAIEKGLAANEVNAIKLALYVPDDAVAGYRILVVY
jgi:predicted Zn finger-like uncharacterized protein